MIFSIFWAIIFRVTCIKRIQVLFLVIEFLSLNFLKKQYYHWHYFVFRCLASNINLSKFIIFNIRHCLYLFDDFQTFFTFFWKVFGILLLYTMTNCVGLTHWQHLCSVFYELFLDLSWVTIQLFIFHGILSCICYHLSVSLFFLTFLFTEEKCLTFFYIILTVSLRFAISKSFCILKLFSSAPILYLYFDVICIICSFSSTFFFSYVS